MTADTKAIAARLTLRPDVVEAADRVAALLPVPIDLAALLSVRTVLAELVASTEASAPRDAIDSGILAALESRASTHEVRIRCAKSALSERVFSYCAILAPLSLSPAAAARGALDEPRDRWVGYGDDVAAATADTYRNLPQFVRARLERREES